MPAPPEPIFDAHLHVVDARFGLRADDGFLPEPFDVAAYRARVAGLGVVGGAVVSGSFQGFDQAYLLDALERLGPGFVGVTQLPGGVRDEQVLALDAAGVRAVRFNLRRGGSESAAWLTRLGRRVAELAGWHVELYVDASELPALAGAIEPLLPNVAIDHLGLSREGLPALLSLVSRGARVKATGFARGDLDVRAALRAIAFESPAALLFGTDLPSTRAPRPFGPADLDLLREALGGDVLVRRALYDNAAALYRLGAQLPLSAAE